MPVKTVRDKVLKTAYICGDEQYIDGKNDPEGYRTQGYESSARKFAEDLDQSTNVILQNALNLAIEGDKNE